jgi:hypothetical protein
LSDDYLVAVRQTLLELHILSANQIGLPSIEDRGHNAENDGTFAFQSMSNAARKDLGEYADG